MLLRLVLVFYSIAPLKNERSYRAGNGDPLNMIFFSKADNTSANLLEQNGKSTQT